MNNRFAQFDDLNIHYQSIGECDNSLIFVHGWTCNADFWREQISSLHGMRMIAIDLPGHGQSSKPKAEYTISYFAQSIEAVIIHAE